MPRKNPQKNDIFCLTAERTNEEKETSENIKIM